MMAPRNFVIVGEEGEEMGGGAGNEESVEEEEEGGKATPGKGKQDDEGDDSSSRSEEEDYQIKPAIDLLVRGRGREQHQRPRQKDRDFGRARKHARLGRDATRQQQQQQQQQQLGPPAQKRKVVCLVSDDEECDDHDHDHDYGDEKLKRPVLLRAETPKKQRIAPTPAPAPLPTAVPTAGIPNRKALEEERLKRVEARRKAQVQKSASDSGGGSSGGGSRSDARAVPTRTFYGAGNAVGDGDGGSSSSSSSAATTSNGSSTNNGGSSGSNRADNSAAAPIHSSSRSPKSTRKKTVALVCLEPEEGDEDSRRNRAVPTSPPPPLPPSPRRPLPPPTQGPHAWYPKGTVKKTFLENRINGPDTIRIQDVLQRDTLATTLLSAFEWDYNWVMDLLPRHRPNHDMIFVMQGKEPADRQLAQQLFGGQPRIELVFPPMAGQVRIMHSKLMLLFHRRGDREWLRVVVPTANLTDYDWGLMTGVMENVRLPSPHRPSVRAIF